MRVSTLSLLSFILSAAQAESCESCKNNGGVKQFSLSMKTTDKSLVISVDINNGVCNVPKNAKPNKHGEYVPVKPSKKKCRHQLPTDEPGQKTGTCKVDYVKGKTEQTKGKTVPGGTDNPTKDVNPTKEVKENKGVNDDDGDGDGETGSVPVPSAVPTSTNNGPSETHPQSEPEPEPESTPVPGPTPGPAALGLPPSTTPGSTSQPTTGGTCAVVSEGGGAVWNTDTILAVPNAGGAVIFVSTTKTIDIKVYTVVGFTITSNTLTLSGFGFFSCSTASSDELHAYKEGTAPGHCISTTVTTVAPPPLLHVTIPEQAPAVVKQITGVTVTAEVHTVATFSYSQTTTTTTTTSTTSWSSGSGGPTKLTGISPQPENPAATPLSDPAGVDPSGNTNPPNPEQTGLPGSSASLPQASAASASVVVSFSALLLPLAALVVF